MSSSSQSCIKVEEYERIPGCKIAPEGTWVSAPSDAIISGLKELPENNDPITGTHVFFAHCFKGQNHAAQLLGQFKRGNGSLYDLEFLVDDTGRRVAAFGKAAGAAGMACGALAYAWAQDNKGGHPAILDTYPSYADLSAYVLEKLKGRKPTVLIVGANGRVGGGAVGMCKSLGIEPVQWDVTDTTGRKGPFPEVLDFDIFLNTIYLPPALSPEERFVFLNEESIKAEKRKLSVIVDVSCDPNNPSNPIPIYNALTSFHDPCLRVVDGPNPLDIISIDHLPSLVPAESSNEFADQLLPHLLEFGQTGVWSRAIGLFEEKRNKHAI